MVSAVDSESAPSQGRSGRDAATYPLAACHSTACNLRYALHLRVPGSCCAALWLHLQVPGQCWAALLLRPHLP
jgi:hypothetical protein